MPPQPLVTPAEIRKPELVGQTPHAARVKHADEQAWPQRMPGERVAPINAAARSMHLTGVEQRRRHPTVHGLATCNQRWLRARRKYSPSPKSKLLRTIRAPRKLSVENVLLGSGKRRLDIVNNRFVRSSRGCNAARSVLMAKLCHLSHAAVDLLAINSAGLRSPSFPADTYRPDPRVAA